VEEVLRLVGEKSIDLVVAASYGLSGLKRMLAGTVVEQLARLLPRPLWVVRTAAKEHAAGTAVGEAIPVVVGCDLESGCNTVARQGFLLAARLGARLHLVHALPSACNEDLVNPTQAPYGEVQEQLRERLREALDELLAPDPSGAVAAQSTVLTGHPGEALLAYGRQVGAGLIVVGVRRRSGVRKWMIGSTTELMLRRSPCSVLTVPAADVSSGR
jgi:nucleotide-binding universal stress UspA family protein